MPVRCKKCLFKNRKGNEYPCVHCNEIIDFKNSNCKTNYFISSKDNILDPINEAKKRLEKRLSILEPVPLKAFTKFTVNDRANIILSAFVVNRKNKIIFYQLTEKDTKLIENKFLLDNTLFEEFARFYYNK